MNEQSAPFVMRANATNPNIARLVANAAFIRSKGEPVEIIAETKGMAARIIESLSDTYIGRGIPVTVKGKK